MANKPGKVYSILQDMIRLIEEKEWGRAGTVPTRNELAEKYHTTTATINDVVLMLRAMGYVMPKGRNIVINPNRLPVPVLVPSFDKYLIGLGLVPYMRNFGDPELVTLDRDTAAAFNLAEGTLAVKRSRVQGERQGTTEIPYRLTETFYLETLAGKYIERMKSDPMFVAIDEIRRETGLSIARSSIDLLTRFPTEREQNLLQIPLHTPVIEYYRVSRAADGTIIMFSRIILISFRFSLSIENAETIL